MGLGERILIKLLGGHAKLARTQGSLKQEIARRKRMIDARNRK